AVGAALGVWLAWWLAGLLASQMTSPALAGLPASLPIAVNPRLVAAAVLLALTSGTLAGLLPAWQAARTSSWTSMSAAAHGHRSRPLELLVVGQLAVSLVLAAGAAAGIRSFVGLVTKPTGLDPDNVLVAAMSGELAGPSQDTRFDTIGKL